jgi:hypothetical protein
MLAAFCPHRLVMPQFTCYYAKDRFVFLGNNDDPMLPKSPSHYYAQPIFVRSFGKSPIRHSVQVYPLPNSPCCNLVIWLTRSTRAVPEKKPGDLHVCAEVVLAFQKAPAVRQNQPRYLFIRTQKRTTTSAPKRCKDAEIYRTGNV